MPGLIYLTDEDITYLSGVIRGDEDIIKNTSPLEVHSLLERIENVE